MDRVHKGNSLTEVVSNFTLIDVETTGYCPSDDSIIEFAGLKVRNGIVIDSYSTLVNPMFKINSFIEQLTGITNEMLVDAPTIVEVIDSIIAFIGDDVIVGHNVNFDVNFVYDAYVEQRNKFLKNDFLDTLRLSRKLFRNTTNHTLATMASLYNKEYFPTHRAMSDCLATQELLQYIYKYLADNNLVLQDLFKKSYKSYHTKFDLKSIVPNTDIIDEDNPLFGLSVCFTGTLDRMVRKDAWQLVANLGGIPMDNVTKTTNLLVLGDLDYKCSKRDKKSNKYKTAESLILKGCDLKIISETTFLDMIDDDFENDYYRN